MQPTPPFLTHRELDTFLGGAHRGPKQRQRLQRLALLPEAGAVKRVQRFNLLVFPRFVLAGLLADFPRLSGAGELMGTLSQQVCAGLEFRELSEALRRSARELPEWRYDMLIGHLVREARPAVQAFSEVVEAAEAQLHDRFDISFAAATGVVRNVTSGVYLVSVNDATERFPEIRAAAPVSEGRAVAVERVKVMGTEQDFLMPSVIDNLQVSDAPADEEQELVAWFHAQSKPVAMPAAVLVEENEHADVLPYRRSAPRQRQWRGVGTMRRIGSTAS